VEDDKMSNKGKRYNQEFKDDILRLIREENRSVSSIVKDFGVNDQTVRNWLKEQKDGQDPINRRIAELETELKAKDKKIADQELTIDILKKATAIFAQNNRK
jgi:transposase-like protein